MTTKTAMKIRDIKAPDFQGLYQLSTPVSDVKGDLHSKVMVYHNALYSYVGNWPVPIRPGLEGTPASLFSAIGYRLLEQGDMQFLGIDEAPSYQSKSKRATDEEAFNQVISNAAYDWDINVSFDEAANRYVCDLYRTEKTIECGQIFEKETLVATSSPFKRCSAAVLWAHRFEVPVFVMADDLYPEDE